MRSIKSQLLMSLLVACFAALLFVGCTGEKNYLDESKKDMDKRMEWWRDARFGMFIHWGAYAVPAGIYKGEEVPGIGEWIMDRANIPIAEYEEFVKQFNPEQFDAEAWVQIAKYAGMKYIVITSKHHDGFCLWDSQVSDYDVIDFAPFGRDILKELADACEKEDIKLCFYHSIMDWHHPDATGENFAKYRDEYLKPQIKELVTNYGDIGVIWFDGEWIDEWTEPQGKDLYNFIRNLKADIIINNRVGKGRQGMQGMNKDENFAGDFGTPEQEILKSASALDWESCMTMNDTWGFKVNDHKWKSSEMLIHNLVDIVAKGGNYLLNVGPTAEGLIPQASIERLQDMGDWMKVNGEVLYDTRAFKYYKENESIRYTTTKDGKVVYATCLEWPGAQLILESVEPNADSDIYLLGVEAPLEWRLDENDDLVIDIPKNLQKAENRPSKYAYSFKIEGQAFSMVEKPVIKSDKNESGENVLFELPASVIIESETPDAKIHYTTDGSTPTVDSPLYTGPINLTQDVKINAKAFKEGMKTSRLSAGGFILIQENTHCLRYNFYEGQWTELPDFSALPIVKSGYVLDFSLSQSNLPAEYFGLVYNGYITIRRAGTYTFYTTSDDGSKVLIDGTVVVNNDGLHGMVEEEGSIRLQAGKHAISVEYFETGGGEGLEVSYKGPGIPKRIIPSFVLTI
jgi:alpha-L-fucosidase